MQLTGILQTNCYELNDAEQVPMKKMLWQLGPPIYSIFYKYGKRNMQNDKRAVFHIELEV